MRIKVIPVALLSSLISVPTFADVEHKFGFKGSYVDQDASHSMLFGKSSDNAFGYGIEYTALSPISTSSENRAKFGINLGFDAFDLEHDVTLSSDRNIIDTEFRVITIAPIFAYSVNNNIDFYVKAGVTLWDADLESKDLSMSYSLDGEDFIFGLGATYQSHNGAYSGIEISKADFSDSGFDVDTVMISIKFGYTFGLNSAR